MQFRMTSLAIVLLMLSPVLLGCPPELPDEGEGEGEYEWESEGEGEDEGNGEGEGEEPNTIAITLPGDVPLEMVWIEPGTFAMGRYLREPDSSPDEDPQHQVTISSGFWLGKYEVTQTQWAAVMDRFPSDFIGAALPVETVSWSEAGYFISELNALTGSTFRLPTEAEWEYAYRAGTQTRFYWGDDPNLIGAEPGFTEIGDFAWHRWNSGFRTHDVGGKLPNDWGLYDMSGNVWEWCQDWYGSYPDESVTDPAGPESGSSRVARGGGWYSSDSCRAANRVEFNSAHTGHDVGFRLAN